MGAQGLDQQLSQTADTSAAAEARKALEEYQQQVGAVCSRLAHVKFVHIRFTLNAYPTSKFKLPG